MLANRKCLQVILSRTKQLIHSSSVRTRPLNAHVPSRRYPASLVVMPWFTNIRRKNRLLTLFSFCLIAVIILIICVCFIDTNSANLSPAGLRGDPGTLLSVHAVFRHGDRNPSNGYPNDPYKDGKIYSEGWSALTLAGKRRLISLGKKLRQRYKDFIPRLYHSNDVYTLSSDADRCIMSAQCLLAGLYPPKDMQIIEPQLKWQPIPVHTVPRDLDKTVAAKRACPRYDKQLLDLYASQELHHINAKYENLLKQVSLQSGANITNVPEAEGLYNTLDIQKSLNLSLPPWVDEEIMIQLKDLATLSLKLFTYTPYMARIRGGPLLGEIRNRIIEKDEGKRTPKLYLVSGHDLTLINILRTMGFKEQSWKPHYAAYLIVELHATAGGGSVVKLLFSNGHESSPLEEISLPGCSSPCPTESFLSLTVDAVPDNWEDECELPTD